MESGEMLPVGPRSELVTLGMAVERYKHLGANKGRLQMAYYRGALPGQKVDPRWKNSPLVFRAADVLAYLRRNRQRAGKGGRPRRNAAAGN